MIFRQNGQTNIGIVVLLFFLAIIIPLFTYLGIRIELSVIFFLAFVVFLVSFLRTDIALFILIFSMLLSPELTAGQVTGRSIKIRADDIFIIVIFLGWIARMAVNKELGFFRVTPINRALQVYILVSLISTSYGAVMGYVKVAEASFYFLKYFEYYLLFFLVTNNLKDRKQAKRFIYCIIFVSFIICIYAWYQHLSGVVRVGTPFEGTAGEANTLGGYLVLIMALAMGLLLNSQNTREKLFLSGIIMLSFPALLFTLSRGSWLALFMAVVTLFILTKRGKKLMIVGALAMVIIAPTALPNIVQKRVEDTFVGKREYALMNKRVTIDDSAAARLDNWKIGLARWSKSPIVGHGISSAGAALDNQYTRILIETGLLGIVCFLWVILSLYRYALFVLKSYKNDMFVNGLTAGFIAGLAGLMIHSFSAATFIIIKIMEPFWFLAAIVVMIPEMPPEGEIIHYDE